MWLLSLRAPTPQLPALPAVPSTSRALGQGHRRASCHPQQYNRRKSSFGIRRSSSKHHIGSSQKSLDRSHSQDYTTSQGHSQDRRHGHDPDAPGQSGGKKSSKGRGKGQIHSQGASLDRTSTLSPSDSGVLSKSLCDSMVRLSIDGSPIFQDEELRAELLAGKQTKSYVWSFICIAGMDST